MLGPSTQVTTWQGYDVKGYRFHTKEKDKKSAAQNSGVRYEGVDKATNSRTQYYGQVEEIWELDYGKDVRVTVFRCHWVNPKAVVVDNYGLTTVNLKSTGYKDDQWVLATKDENKNKNPRPNCIVFYILPDRFQFSRNNSNPVRNSDK